MAEPNHRAFDDNEIEILKSKKQGTSTRSSLLAAIFLMATSAIGPGFITQTANFTAKLGAAFGFAILISILIDFVVQLNIWRIIALTKKRASDIANLALPGSGYVLAVLVIFGGLVFNIANLGGTGLGLNAMINLDPNWGAVISAFIAIFIFLSKRAGVTVDRMMIVLGFIMIIMTLAVAFVSGPPVLEALEQTIFPDVIDFPTITTIIGGTIGGYIIYAGAHRLLESGTVGRENLSAVTKGALSGILVTGVMRYILFLAILGVVAGGANILSGGANANPAGEAFYVALGAFGVRLFGFIFWCAAITSVIGAAYTSVSFLFTFKKDLSYRQRSYATVAFIVISLICYLVLGRNPAALLIFAGGFNGLILPIGLTIFLYVGWFRSDLMGGYHYPRWLLILGGLACILTWYMAVVSFVPIFEFLA